jgi:hypothetical protein
LLLYHKIKKKSKIINETKPNQIKFVLLSFEGRSARRNHIYEGRDQLTVDLAIQISERRNQNRKNTVFQKPKGYRLCLGSDPNHNELIISKSRVKTIVCTYDGSSWKGQEIGKYFAIFVKDLGHHFPGYLYLNINFN